MTLPNFLVTLLSAGMIYLVTQGLKTVGSWVHVDISGYASVVTAALVAAIVAFSNALLSAVPAQYAPLVGEVFSFLGLLIAAFGAHSTLKSLRPTK